MVLRRFVQGLSLCVFLVLLWYAVFPLVLPVPVDLFLRMDPLVLFTTIITTWSFVPSLLLATVIVGLTIIFGRFFCSMVCPMGITIDVIDNLIPPSSRVKRRHSLPRASLKIIKYIGLCFVLAAALLGMSFAYLVAPIPLITRLYGLLIYPVFTLAADAILNLIRPLTERIGADMLVYASLENPRFAFQWINVILFGAIFTCGMLAPRFWCRYLCPAGAIFGIASIRPRLRRRVSEECTSCGMCQNKCPMDAIAEDPHKTDNSECILCRTCSQVCPVDAVRFSFSGPTLKEQAIRFSAHRRALILAGLSGLGTASIMLTSLKGLSREAGPGQITNPSLIRPPGAVPELALQGRCVGCGECMKVCPTNTLQPAGLVAGLGGFLSPVVTPRRGPCEPTCNACGQVCPTKAIREIPLEEKRYAKIGTASITRHKCIAWEFERPCLVCDEVCPYGAIDLKRVDEISVAVPFIDESRCNGCGFCEHFCPVQATAAIVVEPMDALRLEKGSYREKSRELGLSIEPKQQKNHRQGEPSQIPEGSLPPGFTE
jgi:ferredoxin